MTSQLSSSSLSGSSNSSTNSSTTPVHFQKVGIVGCGLMGGSFALAIKKANITQHVVGFSQSTASVDKALQLGAIDSAAQSLLDLAQQCDLILLAVPVAATQKTLEAIAPGLQKNAFIMDVGSTKLDVCEAAELALGNLYSQFLPCHPIAGRERAGIEHSCVDLYENCKVILCPHSSIPESILLKAQSLWQNLGSQIVFMHAQEHDEIYATVSHLPHLLAFAYINSILNAPKSDKNFALAGTGFRDFSRIAGSEPTMWRDILIANQKQVLQSLDAFSIELEKLKQMVATADGAQLSQAISQASNARGKWQLNRSH
jgi:prephenate dehydrogenase